MGLVNARNLRRAKQLLEKNRHKVGDMVGKATEKVDKVSGGKTANLSKKAEEAARKYSAGSSATHHGAHPDAVSDGRGGYSGRPGSMAPADAQTRAAEAQAKAAEAMTGLMQAANGLISQAQARVDAADGTGTPASPPPPPPPSSAVGSGDAPPPLDGPPPLPG